MKERIKDTLIILVCLIIFVALMALFSVLDKDARENWIEYNKYIEMQKDTVK